MDLAKKTFCKGASDQDAALFVAQCKQSGLNPFNRECFFVSRKLNTGSKERPVWVNKYEFQPSEAGMLSRAERFPDYGGISAQAVYAGDDISINSGEGTVHHIFKPTERKGALIGAWSRVVRSGKTPTLIWLDLKGYVQDSSLWRNIPNTMIEKCSRVAALRKAYPSAFGGLYIREEMPAEGVELESTAVPEEATNSRTEALKGELRSKAQASAKQSEATPAAKMPEAYERIRALGERHGLSRPELGALVKQATGKLRKDMHLLDEHDVAQVEAALKAEQALDSGPAHDYAGASKGAVQ